MPIPTDPFANAAYSGLLFGLAAGLKLTALPYCIAGVAASSLTPDVSPAHRLRPTIAFVLAGVLAAAVVGGPWWTMLFSRYQNPVLPFMNQWFSSPFVQPLPFTDERFKPVGLLHALTYPFFWAFKPSSFVAELPVRDPRFALTYLAVVGMVVHHSVGVLKGRRNLDRSGTALFVFFVTAFVLWELMFSILRYLAVLELLTGAMVLLACQPLLAMQHARVPAILGLVAAGVGVQAMTIYPDWGRLPSPTPLLVELPAIEPGGMVVLLDPSPMAYLADLAPPAVLFIGANNNLIRPGGGGLLAHQAENAVRTHIGPLYGLEDPAEVPGIADRTLSFYRLAREGCRQVTSNLDNNVVRLCRLRPAVE